MDVLASRQRFAAQIPSAYRPLRHLAGCVAFGVLGTALSLATLSRVSLTEWLALPLALLACNLGEYAGHRWVMHARAGFLPYAYEAHTLRHHVCFDEDHMAIASARDLGLLLFSPRDIFFFALATVPGLALAGILASRNVLALGVAAVTSHYLFYELAHLTSHLPPQHRLARLRLARGFRLRHALHHGDARICFNVTLPIGDRLFGTLRRRPNPGRASGERY